jgi:hypothetical protein
MGNRLLVLALLASAVSIAAEEPARIKAFCIDFNWGEKGFSEAGLYAGASPQEHVDWYKALGANTIQTFCVSSPGYAWYKSKVAPVQPGMTGEFLPEVVRLGHEAGMKVMGYFTIGANTQWSEKHPDEVHPFRDTIAIPFTLKYLDYLDAVIREAVGVTGIDGFMIDWVYNGSHFYPERTYQWLPCEREMYQELFGESWPGDEAMDEGRTHEFNRRALARCWERIRSAAKETNPNCIIWLTCYDLQHPQLQGSRMLQEVDWLMNEHPDPEKLHALKPGLNPSTQLIQCVCGWGEGHNAQKVFEDPRLKDWGIYGFAKPDPITTLPPEDDSGNAKNIAVMREYFQKP